MRAVKQTRLLAWSAATDAGNRSMRAAGREAWDETDYNAAVAEFERLWPIETELEEKREEFKAATAGKG